MDKEERREMLNVCIYAGQKHSFSEHGAWNRMIRRTLPRAIEMIDRLESELAYKLDREDQLLDAARLTITVWETDKTSKGVIATMLKQAVARYKGRKERND